jgi:hypothetical protein
VQQIDLIYTHYNREHIAVSLVIADDFLVGTEEFLDKTQLPSLLLNKLNKLAVSFFRPELLNTGQTRTIHLQSVYFEYRFKYAHILYTVGDDPKTLTKQVTLADHIAHPRFERAGNAPANHYSDEWLSHLNFLLLRAPVQNEDLQFIEAANIQQRPGHAVRHYIKTNIVIALYNAALNYYREIWAKYHDNHDALIEQIAQFNHLFADIAQVHPNFGISSFENAVERSQHLELINTITTMEQLVNDLVIRCAREANNNSAFTHVKQQLNRFNQLSFLNPVSGLAEKSHFFDEIKAPLSTRAEGLLHGVPGIGKRLKAKNRNSPIANLFRFNERVTALEHILMNELESQEAQPNKDSHAKIRRALSAQPTFYSNEVALPTTGQAPPAAFFNSAELILPTIANDKGAAFNPDQEIEPSRLDYTITAALTGALVGMVIGAVLMIAFAAILFTGGFGIPVIAASAAMLTLACGGPLAAFGLVTLGAVSITGFCTGIGAAAGAIASSPLFAPASAQPEKGKPLANIAPTILPVKQDRSASFGWKRPPPPNNKPADLPKPSIQLR